MGDKALATIRESNADLLHARSDERGYTAITVTPNELRCDFKTTAFPAGSETGFKTQASYVVHKDTPGPQKM
jgi:alkaline phosphatase D